MTTHIATSVAIGKAVQRGLRVPVGFVSDNLLVGPCAEDPEAHGQERRAFWGLRGRDASRFSASLRALSESLQSSERVTFWTSRSWSDTITLWALCAWRLRHRPEQPGVDVIVLGGAVETGLGHESIPVTPADARRASGEASPLSRTRVRDLARCWRRVSGPSPVLVDGGGRAGAARSELVELGTYQAAFFPRWSAGALFLSRFDELLFSCLDGQWSTPVQVFVRRSPVGEELRKWVALTGDVFLAMRLRQWAAHHAPAAALESEPCVPENVMKEARYRLSDAGDAIRRRGLDAVAQGAPLPVWGVRAYDPVAPWVVEDDDTEQRRLRRLEENLRAGL